MSAGARARQRDGSHHHDRAARGRSRLQRWAAKPDASMVGASCRHGRDAFPTTGGACALALTALTIVAVTLGVHPAWTLADPTPVMAVLALLVGVATIVWALEGAELHHRDEAVLDQLTGLLNRHTLLARFQEITQQARLAHQPVCLILVDLDRFKDVNDRYGHDRGDAVLRAVAYEMRKQLRSFELIYRLGGEEFLIVLPGVDLHMGRMLAERLREAIGECAPAGIP